MHRATPPGSLLDGEIVAVESARRNALLFGYSTGPPPSELGLSGTIGVAGAGSLGLLETFGTTGGAGCPAWGADGLGVPTGRAVRYVGRFAGSTFRKKSRGTSTRVGPFDKNDSPFADLRKIKPFYCVTDFKTSRSL